MNEKKDGREEGTYITNKANTSSPLLSSVTAINTKIKKDDDQNAKVEPRKISHDRGEEEKDRDRINSKEIDLKIGTSVESSSTIETTEGVMKSVEVEPAIVSNSWEVPNLELNPSVGPSEKDGTDSRKVSTRLSTSLGHHKDVVDLNLASLTQTNSSSTLKEIDASTNLNPAFIALQLCASFNIGGEVSPLLKCNNSDDLDRAIKLLDRTPCVETHKIGLVYIGEGQTKENEILFNSKGSSRYMLFLHNLGTLIKFDEIANEGKYMGGLGKMENIIITKYYY